MTHQEESQVSDSTAVAPTRGPDGKLLPGHPGLPGGGRPRGITNADLIRTALEQRRDDLIGQVLKNAFNPDGHVSNRALELALSRIAPPPRQESERVIIPGFKDAKTLQEKAEAVIAAIATGEVTAEAGEKLLRVLDTYGRAVVTTELERRLEALEQGRRPPVVTIDATVVEAESDLV